MWASQPGPPRSGWTGKSSESGSGLRGKGSSRGRGGRGGGRGGRAPNGRNSQSSKPEPTASKPIASADQPQEKPSSDPPKRSSQPSSIPPTSQPQSNAPSRQSNRPRPARKGSESKGPRKGPTLTVDPSATSTSNTSSSPSVSPHTPSRRKRGGSKASAPAPVPAIPEVPRKQSVSQENSAPKEAKEKLPPAKDIPPHLAPPPPAPPSAHFDIEHDIDALVERVRAVAMDRPHTPGSHIDWAGDEDDSLPDLDDWGVPSTTTSASSQPPDPPKVTDNFISPILQDTLKPLPMIDIDIPTPSIRLHEVNENIVRGADGGDETPRETVPSAGVDFNSANARTSSGPSSTTSRSNGTSTRPSSVPSPAKNLTTVPTEASNDVPEGPSINGRANLSAHPGDAADSSPSPPRGLSGSVHASTSMPNAFPSRPPRAAFQPAHGRSQTVGRFKPEYRAGSERPQREISHGRNHSTPPTGPGPARGRTAHTTRPVISGDAISRLARTLGGAAPPRKPKDAAPTAAEAA